MTELEAHPAAPPASAGFPTFGLAAWSIIIPVLGVAALALGKPAGITMAVALGIILAGVVMAAVYHAEVLAHYLGEPFGTLVLALAVTVIETSLIVSIMMTEAAEGSGTGSQTLARDTLMAAIMITINGIVGICLLTGGRRHHEQSYTLNPASVPVWPCSRRWRC